MTDTNAPPGCTACVAGQQDGKTVCYACEQAWEADRAGPRPACKPKQPPGPPRYSFERRSTWIGVGFDIYDRTSPYTWGAIAQTNDYLVAQRIVDALNAAEVAKQR